jgi:hypothetical protein
MEPDPTPTIYETYDRLADLLITALEAEDKTYDQAKREADQLLDWYDWHQRQPIR